MKWVRLTGREDSEQSLGEEIDSFVPVLLAAFPALAAAMPAPADNRELWRTLQKLVRLRLFDIQFCLRGNVVTFRIRTPDGPFPEWVRQDVTLTGGSVDG